MDKLRKKIKCVIWDLDNTIWKGVLLESPNVILNKNIIKIIRLLDERGILHSIASKNNFEQAYQQLRLFKIDDFFIYPTINWNSKAHSIRKIAQDINIGLDSIAFVDDQIFEREEVQAELPEILCLSEKEILAAINKPEFIPIFITEDSKNRRKLYQTDIIRKQEEDNFIGPKEEFLATLSMRFNITKATEVDLHRAEELTIRTNQLNTTGITYSYAELKSFLSSKSHEVLITELKDKYGSYGKIGLAIIEQLANNWTIKLLLMSCRVISRGVGTILLNYIRHQAKNQSINLYANFIPTEKNRMMHITYKFNGFSEVKDTPHLFINDLSFVPEMPNHVKILTPSANLFD